MSAAERKPVPGLVEACESLDTTIRKWLGTHPDSEVPQTEPGYEAKLRSVGAYLMASERSAPESLLALALVYTKLAKDRGRVDLLGRAHQLFVAAKALEGLANDAEVMGRELAAKGAPS